MATEDPPLAIAAVDSTAADALVADAESAGLTARDSAGRVVPGLAQSWRLADDGLSIVFRLRPARFADDSEVTAADVVASIERARRAPGIRDLLGGIDLATAPLPDVVELRLGVPQPELLELLATPELAIRPRGRGSARAGPFLRASGEPGEQGLLLERNPRYHGAEGVGLAAARIVPMTADEAVRRFARGEADLVTGGFHRGIGSARALNRRDRLLLEAPPAALLLLVNHGRGPLGDVRVRTALAMAIDRAAIGPALFGSEAAAALPGLVPASLSAPIAWPEWAGRPLVERQAEARRLLADAGVIGADQMRPRLAVSTTDDPADERLVTALARDLAAIGVDLTLARRSATGHARAITAGDFELALALRVTPYRSPLPFLLDYRCGRNRHGACVPDADKLLAAAWETADPAERARRLVAAERLWVDEGVAIGLIQPLAWSLVSARVGGFVPNSTGIHTLRHLTFDPSRRSLT
jgi:ABC-type transport system substrate-binding protein